MFCDVTSFFTTSSESTCVFLAVGHWLVDVGPSFALGAPEIILYKVTIGSSFSISEKVTIGKVL